MAPRDIEPGADYPAAIVDAIRSSRLLVLILTEHAAASPHVLTEVGHAFNGKQRILPFRLMSAALPPDFDYFLSTTHWLDAADGCTPENLNRLLEAARETLAPHAGPAPAAPPPSSPHQPLYTGLAVAALLLAALAYWQWPRPVSSPATGPPKQAEPAPIATPPVNLAPPHPAPAVWINPKDGQPYVRIPPGSFTMGCSTGDAECRENEKPAHRVNIEKAFWLAQTEVPNRAWRKVSQTKTEGDENVPATGMSWSAASAYCSAVGGRLPAEAEWEYAARGGRPEPYYGVPSAIAWYAPNSNGGPRPVGTKKPNAFQLFDMLGNVSEWVLDRYYNRYYPDGFVLGDVDQPFAPNASAVARGGFWDAEPADIRVSHRSEMPNDEGAPTVGFRCAVDRP